MKTLGRNSDNDLYLEAGKLAEIHNADAQCAIIESVLATQQGELQFDEEGGIDYFGTVLLNPTYINFWAEQVRSKIEALDFVSEVEDFQYRFERETSTLFWSMTVVNTDEERLDLTDRRIVIDGSPGNVEVQWKDIYGKPKGMESSYSMVKSMRDEALDAETLKETSTLYDTKEILNRVLYDTNQEGSANNRSIRFEFMGVPVGAIIDFSNLRVGLRNTPKAETPQQDWYAPFTVEISDGTTARITAHKDGSALDGDDNDIWFEADGKRTYEHIITQSNNVSISIRGNIESLSVQDTSKGIFLLAGGQETFQYLYSVGIGNRILLKRIGDSAFKGFKNLQQITWQSEGGSLSDISIGEEAFCDCSSLSSLTWMPAGTVQIGAGCFKNCTSLTSLKGLPAVETIPAECFKGCSMLASLEYLPESLIEIGEGAFADCTSLKDITGIPNGIATLGEGCFEGCTGIESLLYLPDSINVIGARCFKGCTSLRSLYLPAALSPSSESTSESTAAEAYIGADAFAECTALDNIMCEGDYPPVIGADTFPVEALRIYVPKGFEEIYKQAEGWKDYKDTIFGYGSVTFKLEDVDERAMLLSTTSRIVSDSIWEVKFEGTDSRPQRFESSVTNLPQYVYSKKPHMDDSSLGESRNGKSNIVVKGFIRELSAVSETSCPLVSVQNNRVASPLKEVKIDLTTSLETIGDYAFAFCSNLENVSVEEASIVPFDLGKRAFYGCSSLTTTAWLEKFSEFGHRPTGAITEAGEPEFYPAFGEGCFYRCSALSTLSFPLMYVTSLPSYCFAETGISSISGLLKEGEESEIQSLGSHCFYRCRQLEDISALVGLQKLTSLPSYCFAGCTKLRTLFGINGSQIKHIGSHAFEDCTWLTTIEALSWKPDITELSDYCFAGCVNLESLEGIENIIQFGKYCFSGCRKISDLTYINSNVRNIPEGCFAGCTSLKTLSGCGNIGIIWDRAFQGCTGLLSTSGLGFGLREIYGYAFSGCSNLKFVSCVADMPPYLEATAFDSSKAATIPLYVRSGREELYSTSTGWSSFNRVLSRTVKVHYEDISQIAGNDSYVFAEIKDGEDAISGIWYVDYGNGVVNTLKGDGPIPAYDYLESGHGGRGAYDIMLFGDIVCIAPYQEDGYSSTAETSSAGGFPPPPERAFLEDIKHEAASVIIQSEYLEEVGYGCFYDYGQQDIPLNVSISMKSGGAIGEYAFAKSAAAKEAGYGAIEEIATCNAGKVLDCAFRNCSLTSSASFSTVTLTGRGAFANNIGLADLSGFGVLETIGPRTFDNCKALTSTQGLSSATTIGFQAFLNCTGLTAVRDMTAVDSIASQAFKGCSNIQMVLMAQTIPPTLADDGFDSAIYENAVLYVPAGAEGAYHVKSDPPTPPGWGRFANIRSRAITFTMSQVFDGLAFAAGTTRVTANGAWTISYGGQESFTFSSGVTVLPAYTLQRETPGQDKYDIEIKISGAVTDISCSDGNGPIFCSRIKSMGNPFLTAVSSTPGMEIVSFGNNLFKGCSNLQSVTNVETLQSIGDYAFADCVNLEDVSGLSNISTIGNYAFSGCTLLQDLSPLRNVVSIGRNAFAECSAIETLFGMSSVQTIGDYAFAYCSSLKRIDGLGIGVTSIGHNAFAYCALQEVQMLMATPPTVYEDTFTGLDYASVPLYVRRGRAASYGAAEGWRLFEKISSRTIEFILTECKANTSIIGGKGIVKSDTFWVASATGATISPSGGVECKAGMTTHLPEIAFGSPGTHTIYLDGAITEIAGSEGVMPENPPTVEIEGITITMALEEVLAGLETKPDCFLNIAVNGEPITGGGQHPLNRVNRTEDSPLSTIGDTAFLYNEKFDYAVDLKGVKKIGQAAFAFSGITQLWPAFYAEDIGHYAFYKGNYIDVDSLYAETIKIGHLAFVSEEIPPVGPVVSRINYVQFYATNPEQVTVEDDSFGELGGASGRILTVYVPIGTVKAYEEHEPWSDKTKYRVACLSIIFVMENVPSGTTIIGSTESSPMGGTGWVSSQSPWKIDWDDGTIDSMTVNDKFFPQHTYVYRQGDSGWTEKQIGGATVMVLPKVEIKLNGNISELSAFSDIDYPFIATERGLNPYLTRVECSSSMEELKTIGGRAFMGCGALQTVRGFDKVETIGHEAFSGCSKLVLPDTPESGFESVLTIESEAFYGCTSITGLQTFASLTTIGPRAFANCISLYGTSGMGSSYGEATFDDCPVCEFGAYAFEGCQFRAIDMENYARPPWILTSTFPGEPNDVYVFVKPASLNKYKEAPVWNLYFDNIIASATVSLKFKAGVLQPGDRFEGDNGLVFYSGAKIYVDWGDGTQNENEADETTAVEGWTLPSHTFSQRVAAATSVKIRLRGKIFIIRPKDVSKPIMTIKRGGEAIEPAMDVDFGEGSYLQALGEGCFRNCNIGSLHFGRPKNAEEENSSMDIGASAFQDCNNLTAALADDGAISAIGESAFEGCSGLKMFELPHGCVSIGAKAFKGCEALSTSDPSSTATAIFAIPDAYTPASTVENPQPETFPGCVTIGEEAFRGCKSIMQLSLPRSLTTVGDFAFADNIGLITIGWKSPAEGSPSPMVGAGCFEGCSNLSSITEFGNIRSLPAYCFYLCKSLPTATINSILQNAIGGIGKYCFAGCYRIGAERNIEGITIPQAVTSLGEGCFNQSDELLLKGEWQVKDEESQIIINGNGKHFSVDEFEKAMSKVYALKRMDVWSKYDSILRNTDNSISRGRFSLSWEVGSGIVSIGEGCFMNCSGMTLSGQLPTGLVSIPSYCFYGCSALTNVGNLSFLPDGIKNFGRFALAETDIASLSLTEPAGGARSISARLPPALFFKCENLISLDGLSNLMADIPPSLPDATFYGCATLADITEVATSPITRLGNYCFYGCVNLQSSISVTAGAMNLESSSSSNGELELRKIDLRRMLSIGDYCFANCTALTVIPEFPLSNVILGIGIFKGCYNIVTCDGALPAVEELPDEMFKGCTRLSGIATEEVAFPNTIESLGASCFEGCKALTGEEIAKISSRIKRIGEKCFAGCTGLAEYLGMPFLYNYPARAFAGCTNLSVVRKLSDSNLSWFFEPSLNAVAGLYQRVRITFHPWSLGIVDGWYIRAIGLTTGPALDADAPSAAGDSDVPVRGKYRLVIKIGAEDVRSEPVDVPVEPFQKIQFEFNEVNQKKLVFDNTSYEIKIVGVDANGNDVEKEINLAVDDTAMRRPPFFIKGYSSPWLRPEITIASATDNAPLLFSPNEDEKDSATFAGCANINRINLSDCNSKVAVPIEGDPFPDIAVVDSKKNARVEVRPELLYAYQQDAYWQKFAAIVPYIKPQEFGNVEITLVVPAEGGTIYGGGSITMPSDKGGMIDWGDGTEKTSLGSGEQIIRYNESTGAGIKHTYAPAPYSRTVTLTIYGCKKMAGFYTASPKLELSPVFYTRTSSGASIQRMNDWATKLYIANGVTSLGDECFRGFTKLGSYSDDGSVVIGGDYRYSLEEIGRRAFANCDFTRFPLQNSIVKKVGLLAFSNNASLSDITELNTNFYITSLPSGCFSTCSALTSIKGVDRIQVFGSNVFSGVGVESFQYTDESGSTVASVFSPTAKLGVKSFENCTSLQSLAGLPESLSTLPVSCFQGCTALKNLAGLPEGVRTIGASCFENCSGLENLSGLQNCTSLSALPNACFKGCINLEYVIADTWALGTNIATIGEECFKGCSKIKQVSVSRNSTTAPAITTLGNNAFEDFTAQDVAVVVMNGNVNAYKTAWSAYFNPDNIVEPSPESTT